MISSFKKAPFGNLIINLETFTPKISPPPLNIVKSINLEIFMKSFSEMLKILEESNLSSGPVKDFLKSTSRQNDYRFSSRQGLRPAADVRRRAARFAGLPTEKKDDKSLQIKSSFERLRHHLTTVGGDLKKELSKARVKGMYPDLFPSENDIFAGFTPEQIRMLQTAIKNSYSFGGSRGMGSSPLNREIDSKVGLIKFKRAAARVPFEVRLQKAAEESGTFVSVDMDEDELKQYDIRDYDGQEIIMPKDLDPSSPKYKDTIILLKKKGFLGPDAKELSSHRTIKWLKQNGYWQ
jgi:hypothetical protein